MWQIPQLLAGGKKNKIKKKLLNRSVHFHIKTAAEVGGKKDTRVAGTKTHDVQS